MIPTKAKTLIPIVAERTGMTEEFVTDLIDAYYKLVRQYIEKTEHPVLRLTNLGVLRLSRTKTKNKIGKIEHFINNRKQDRFKDIIVKNDATIHLNQLRQILDKTDNHYKLLYEKRAKNMERKRQNSGGDKE